MGYGFQVEVWGDYALFTRPELKVEKVSYDCMTPSAARGILEAVFWKPAIKYQITQITVINPIQFTNIRRNEVKDVISANNVRSAMKGGNTPLYISTSNSIAQRASTILRDVRYVISAHFTLTDKAQNEDTPEKFYNMILRRLRKGQNFHTPYLGCREFPANVRLIEHDEAAPQSTLEGTQDLGLMLYDMDYTDEGRVQATYFRARMIDGVIDLRNCEVLR
ncbi:type I-C CRISPR-associated protein Cas5c [Eubacteriales bacterium OttesenSCG-928-K08]|nr:type I-C CRISPR-associated protein Cas5c [Eubacteriales bacterium OttesenSCG-928-K08]